MLMQGKIQNCVQCTLEGKGSLLNCVNYVVLHDRWSSSLLVDGIPDSCQQGLFKVWRIVLHNVSWIQGIDLIDAVVQL